MTDKNSKQILFVRDDASNSYSEIDISGWEPGERFIELSTEEDFPEGEDWLMYYPWQGEAKIEHRLKNGRLWVNDRIVGIDLRKVTLDELEDRTTILTAKALPNHLPLLKNLPNLLSLEVLEGKDDLSPLAGLNDLRFLSLPKSTRNEHLSYIGQLVSLRKLHVNSAQITEAGLDHLKNLSNLRQLELLPLGNGEGWLTDNGMASLKNLVNLRELNLFWERVTDNGLSHIRRMSKLNSLTLDGTPISYLGLRNLEGLYNLQHLSLDFMKVTDDGLKHLVNLANLKELSLMATRISDYGLEDLLELKSLEVLILTDTRITDIGLKKLQGLESLRFIDLSETEATRKGIEEFQKVLPNCVVSQNVKRISSSSFS